MRTKRRGGFAIAAAVLGSALCGCALLRETPAVAPPIQAARESAKPAVAASEGTVLVVRDDRLDDVLTERAQLLRAVGGAGITPRVPWVEVVVRRDDGRVVALMQPPDNELVAGRRVLLGDGGSLCEIGSAVR